MAAVLLNVESELLSALNLSLRDFFRPESLKEKQSECVRQILIVRRR